jgi:hypothetical protein
MRERRHWMKFDVTGEEAAVDYLMLHSYISLERQKKIIPGASGMVRYFHAPSCCRQMFCKLVRVKCDKNHFHFRHSE